MFRHLTIIFGFPVFSNIKINFSTCFFQSAIKIQYSGIFLAKITCFEKVQQRFTSTCAKRFSFDVIVYAQYRISFAEEGVNLWIFLFIEFLSALLDKKVKGV